MSLQTWSWAFLGGYAAIMVAIGQLGRRRIANADDFATARGSYGPIVLALAFASTAASGATFLGLPGLAYTYGVSALWIAFCYPLGIYIGVLLCRKAVSRVGNQLGTRTIPEFLGELYQSDLLRISAAVFSLVLVFYLASQLVAGLVMFEMLLGVPKGWALIATTAVMLAYVTTGGAHADILTDAAQGVLMIAVAVGVGAMFLVGVGTGGLHQTLLALNDSEPALLEKFNSGSSLTASYWAVAAVIISHIPLGLLPHIGNKLWALRDERRQNTFVAIAFCLSLLLPVVTFGGLIARATLGNELFDVDGGANMAIPALFASLFPGWLAALLGITILAAIMSTADGLIISTSQVFANDIYRRTIVPRIRRSVDEASIERNVLWVSRLTTVLVLIGASLLGWLTLDVNVVLLMWAGVGGFVAALMGPMVLGCIWTGVTRTAALAGFWTGALAFLLIHGQLISGEWLADTTFENAGQWFDLYATNPYSAATIGAGLSVLVTVAISLFAPGEPSPKHATA